MKKNNILIILSFLMLTLQAGSYAACIGIGYGHLDCCWQWSTAEGIQKMVSASNLQISNMNSYPTFKYSHDGACMDEWMEKYYPSIFASIKTKVNGGNGQWEPMASWTDGLQDFIDGEAHVRNIIVAQWYYYDKYDGAISDIRGAPDNFSGFLTGNYPQIMKKCGLAMHWFCRSPGGVYDGDGQPIWWWANDGTKFPCYRTPKWFNCARCGCGISTANWSTAVTYGQGDGGGGPSASQITNGCNSSGCNSYGKFKDLYNSVIWANVTANWGDTSGDGRGTSRMVNDNATGVYCHRPFLKVNHRMGMDELMDCEKFANFARTYGGYTFPNQYIVDSWKKLLYWEHHDSFGGNYSWNGTPEAKADLTEARTRAATVTDNALDVIESYLDTTGTGVSVVVYNPLAWVRSEVVEVTYSALGISASNNVDVMSSTNVVIPSQVVTDAVLGGGKKVIFLAKNIPGMGYEIFKVVDLGATPSSSFLITDPVIVTGTAIENANVKVVVQGSGTKGWWSSVVDKSDGNRETVSASLGNMLGDASTPNDANYGWNWNPGFAEEGNANSVAVVESGPVRGKIRVLHGVYYQDTIVTPEKHRIDCHFHSTACPLSNQYVGLRFNLTTTSTEHSVEAAYGYATLPNTLGHSPCINWIDISDATRGVSLISDSRYGYDTDNSFIQLDLISRPDFADQYCYYSYYPH